MSTDIEACNMALGHLGSNKLIASIDERSQEAQALRTFYDVAFKATIRDFYWKFTQKFAPLQLVAVDPVLEWKYAYRYPNDCANFKRIESGYRSETMDSKIPFVEAFDSSGKLIYTDMEDAVGEYAANVTNLSWYPPDFVIAFSYRLAHYVGPMITGGNAFSALKKDLLQYYKIELSKAKENSANEMAMDRLPDSEFIQIRGDIDQELTNIRRG